MQTEYMLKIWVSYFEIEMYKIVKEFKETLDGSKLESEIQVLMKGLEAWMIGHTVEKTLADREVLKQLKILAGRKGMRYKEYRTLKIRLHNGIQVEIRTPYFVRIDSKRGKKKKGPNGRGCHLGLEVMGIRGQATPNCLSFVTQMGLLCPSFEVAQAILEEQGVSLDVKTIRRYCRVLGEKGLSMRGEVSLDGSEDLSGATVVIGIDGGRLRIRRRKRGRRPAELKRQGFHTDWKEPKLFTIYPVDEKGEIIQDFSPLHDATMGNHEAMIALLEKYLSILPLADARRIVFTGDGAPWIWSGVTDLCQRLQLEMTKVHQVLDFTHAKQQLAILRGYVSKDKQKRENLEQKWLSLLWNGDIDTLKADVQRLCTGTRKTKALRKWRSYFQTHQSRITYAHFQSLHIPRGSGAVESAIRRIINLRLKAPGSFWTFDMAEIFLFLRSQLLSGRWHIFMLNLSRHSFRLLHKYQETLAS